MARKQVITRTIKGTVLTVKVIDNETEQFETMSIKLPRTISDDSESISKYLAKHPPIGKTVFKVLDKTTVEDVYGMTEERFLAFAQLLDDERKPVIGTWIE